MTPPTTRHGRLAPPGGPRLGIAARLTRPSSPGGSPAASPAARARRRHRGPRPGRARRSPPARCATLAAGRRCVVVTGTNGKSTTTRLIARGARRRRRHELHRGQHGARASSRALDDSRSAIAVLETDELHVPSVMRADRRRSSSSPLNLTRDQLDRTHEVSRTSQVWGEAFAGPRRSPWWPTRPTRTSSPPPWTARPVWVDPGTALDRGRHRLPALRQAAGLDRRRPLELRAAGWRCPTPDYALTADGRAAARRPRARRCRSAARRRQPRQRRCSRIATAAALGVAAGRAAARLATVDDVDGRYATLDLGGRPAAALPGEEPGRLGGRADHDRRRRRARRRHQRPDRRRHRHVVAVRRPVRAARRPHRRRDRRPPRRPRRPAALRRRHARRATTTWSGWPPSCPPGPLVVAANYTAFREMRRYVS